MRKVCPLLYAWWIPFISVQAFASPKKVFILSGQSNMRGLGKVSELTSSYSFPQVTMYYAIDGQNSITTVNLLVPGNPGADVEGLATFGPEIGIAQTLTSRFPGEQLVFIKVAWSATNLRDHWLNNVNGPINCQGCASAPVYTWFKNRVNESLGLIPGPFLVCGMVWMQGEGDAGDLLMASNYATNLKTFVEEKVRPDLGLPALPFIYGEIKNAVNATKGKKRWPYGDTVQTQQIAAEPTINPPKCVFQTSAASATVYDEWDFNVSSFNSAHYNTLGTLNVGTYLGQGLIQRLNGIYELQITTKIKP